MDEEKKDHLPVNNEPNTQPLMSKVERPPSAKAEPWQQLKMWEPKSCCCCSLPKCFLKSASLAWAIFTLIGACMGTPVGFYLSVNSFPDPAHHASVKAWHTLFFIVGTVYFFVSLSWLVVSSLYIHGVRKSKYLLLLPMVVWQGIHMVIVFLLFVFILYTSGISIALIIIHICIFLWDFCVFFVLRANYLQIGRDTADIPMVLHNSDEKSDPEVIIT